MARLLIGGHVFAGPYPFLIGNYLNYSYISKSCFALFRNHLGHGSAFYRRSRFLSDPELLIGAQVFAERQTIFDRKCLKLLAESKLQFALFRNGSKALCGDLFQRENPNVTVYTSTASPDEAFHWPASYKAIKQYQYTSSPSSSP